VCYTLQEATEEEKAIEDAFAHFVPYNRER